MKAKSLNYWPTREFPVHTLLMEGYNANSTDGNLKISTEIKYPGGSDGKVSAYNTGDLGSIPGSGRSPGEGNGNPLQYSCLENSMDQGAW